MDEEGDVRVEMLSVIMSDSIRYIFKSLVTPKKGKGNYGYRLDSWSRWRFYIKFR